MVRVPRPRDRHLTRTDQGQIGTAVDPEERRPTATALEEDQQDYDGDLPPPPWTLASADWQALNRLSPEPKTLTMDKVTLWPARPDQPLPAIRASGTNARRAV